MTDPNPDRNETGPGAPEDATPGSTPLEPVTNTAPWWRVGPWALVRSVAGTLISLLFILGIGAGVVALYHPQSPLPSAWNPTLPLEITDERTALTDWKLRRALSDGALCARVMDQSTRIDPQPPLDVSDTCGIPNRVRLQGLTRARLDGVETQCATALRLAMWEHHGLQPAARDILGSEVAVIRHIGSYNCRRIRGSQSRWSTHATAAAIDITGVDLADGRRIRLLRDWGGDRPEARFLRQIRDSSCAWFGTTLGPDYNRLHADHFHFQNRGWGLCR